VAWVPQEAETPIAHMYALCSTHFFFCTRFVFSVASCSTQFAGVLHPVLCAQMLTIRNNGKLLLPLASRWVLYQQLSIDFVQLRLLFWINYKQFFEVIQIWPVEKY
jgi:hypothetical protein